VRIRDGVVVLSQEEVDSRACPTNLRWGLSQLAAYGLDLCGRSEKLGHLLQCPALLDAAGIAFEVEPGSPEEPASVVEPPSASNE